MPRLDEVADPTQMQGILRDGLEALDLEQAISFQRYTRVVFKSDGFVFWSPIAPKVVKGALTFGVESLQNEDETLGSATCLFTSEAQVTDFFDGVEGELLVATNDAGFRFAFSQQNGYFQQADLWHYWGRSIPPALSNLLLDDPNSIDPDRPVLSNSMPLWLGLNGFSSLYYGGFSNKGVPFTVAAPILYPSYLVSPNLKPPYGSVHIPEDYPQALQATPWLDRNRNHWQLVTDRVRITLFGLQNDEAMDFVDTVNQYSLVTDNIGIMDMPIVRDGIRVQNELSARAMKKVIDFQVSYYQVRSAQVARQLILSAPYQFILGGSQPPPPPVTGNVLTDDAGNRLTTDSGDYLTVDL